MKIKHVKSEKGLKAGAYIRAVINLYGDFFLDYVVITGKPFNSTSASMTGYRKISMVPTRPLTVGSYKKGDIMASLYITTLLGYGRTKLFPTVLIPFSNKAWNYLAGFTDVRSFADALTGKPCTDAEYHSFCMRCMTDRLLAENLRNERNRLGPTAEKDSGVFTQF